MTVTILFKIQSFFSCVTTIHEPIGLRYPWLIPTSESGGVEPLRHLLYTESRAHQVETRPSGATCLRERGRATGVQNHL
jgi:hypothetical protein